MNHFIAVGATAPSYETRLDTGKQIGAGTVRFRMRRQGVHGATLKIDKDIVVVDNVNNVVRVDFLVTETDERGYYDAQFKITYPDTTIEYIPPDGPSLEICVGEAL